MADFMEGLATHKTGSDNDPMLGYIDLPRRWRLNAPATVPIN